MKHSVTLLVLLGLAGCKDEPPATARSTQAVRATAPTTAPALAPAPSTAAGATAAAAALQPVASGGLCMTKGAVSPVDATHMSVTEPKIRGVVAGSDGESAELKFVYRGPTTETAPLASGQLRLQLGLKLRAADGCNVVYVMWRIDPTPGLEVSIKRNPGQRVSSECGTNGYVKIAMVAPIPTLTIGSAHTLRAEIVGGVLIASIDGAEVWRDALGTDAVGLVGPAGFRSDNVGFDFELDTVTKDPSLDCTSILGGD